MEIARCYPFGFRRSRYAGAAMVKGMLLTCKEYSSTAGMARSFSALMDLYERNYILVRRLMPRPPDADTRWVSRVADGLPLELKMLERHRYTSDIRLSYRFERRGMIVLEPDLRVRVYHDARAAEVMAAHLRHLPDFPLPTESGMDIRDRWRVNRFLYKWLGYCLHQGHRFQDRTPESVV